MPDELRTEVRDIVQETGSKTIPKKVSESEEIPGVTGKYGLGRQNEAGKRLSFANRMHWS